MIDMTRRSFLSTAWKVGFGLIAAAGAVTTLGLLKPQLAAGFALVALFEDTDPDNPLSQHMATYMATCAQKPEQCR